MNLTNIIKPTHICNLSCKYCYNEDTRAPIMTRETLARVIQESFNFCRESSSLSEATFLWHGGEPLVAKLSFFERAIALQRESSQGIKYNNTIQTNGTLIDVEWIRFFKENDFSVSISIDGPRHLNDANRIYGDGKGSFDKVMKGINLVKQAGIPLGICVVINKKNKDFVEEIYDFLAKEKLPFNIIPMTRGGDAVNIYDDIGLGPAEYAEPWIKMFDKWFYADDDNYTYCSEFGNKTNAIVIGAPSDCVGQKVCAKYNISTDPDGYVYPCATLSANDDWSYGNINEQTLSELVQSVPAQKVLNRQVDSHCLECKWQHVCHGGCLSRAVKFYGTVDTRDYYCPSLYTIYEHIEKRLREQNEIDLSNLPSESFKDCRKEARKREVVKKYFIRPTLKKEAIVPIKDIKGLSRDT